MSNNLSVGDVVVTKKTNRPYKVIAIESGVVMFRHVKEDGSEHGPALALNAKKYWTQEDLAERAEEAQIAEDAAKL